MMRYSESQLEIATNQANTEERVYNQRLKISTKLYLVV